MNDTDRLAAERILKARVELVTAHTFYGVLVSNVAPKPSRAFPTMATDGKTHFYNPDFIATLTQNELLGVQRHESEHDARRHHSRRGARDPKEWNIATDYAINIDLVDEGVTLPKGALVDPQYRGWSAEDIYRARELDRAKQQQQQQQGDGEDDDDDQPSNGGADEEQDDAGNDDAGDQQDEGDEAGKESGNSPGDEGGDEAGEADGQGGEEEGDTDGDEAGGNAGEAAGEPSEEPGKGSGTGGESSPEAAGEPGEAGEPGGTSGDPGGCGEVLDAADEPAGLSDADSTWERVLRQAASLAAKRGNAPGHVTREIERADKPPQDWRETLRAYFDQGAVSRETWSRPNRRFAGGGLYLPGREREGINRIVFLIDTSGSMDDIALGCIETETRAALDEGIIDEAVVVYGDTRVTKVDTYRNGDEIEFDPRGGGGTVLKPLFDYVRDEIEDPTLIVCFTDGYIDDVAADGEPPCDVLWAYTGYPDAVRSMIETAPWGAPAIDVGSH